MGFFGMKKRPRIFSPALIVAILFTLAFASSSVLASETKFGIGLKVGAVQLDGDWKASEVTPIAGVRLFYKAGPFLSIVGETDFSYLIPKDDRFPGSASKDYKTLLAPAEISLQFDFSPLATVSPFVAIGGGVLWWDARYQNKTILLNGEKQQMTTPFVKTGGGLQFRLRNGLALSVGADFRYVFTDYLDQLKSGDEQDAVVTAWGGLSYAFASTSDDDRDGDNIPDELDLDPETPEVFNGYMDHDGKPDGVRSVKKTGAPIVLHHPIFKAYAGKSLPIKAVILTSSPLRVAAVLYRQKGKKTWSVLKLEKSGQYYEGKIPGEAVTGNRLEYCIVAVNKQANAIGYSGLPKRPIQVQVLKNATTWRILSGTVAALGWGSAVYVGLRKQKN